MQGELAVKNVELAIASQEAEKLLKDISANTALAEVEKGKVAVIVDQVSTTAAVRTFMRVTRLVSSHRVTYSPHAITQISQHKEYDRKTSMHSSK